MALKLIILFIANGIFICGLYHSATRENVLYWLRIVMGYFPSIISSPVISCCHCMSSIYGTVFLLAFYFYYGLEPSWFTAFVYIAYLFSLVFYVLILSMIYTVLNDIHLYFILMRK